MKAYLSISSIVLYFLLFNACTNNKSGSISGIVTDSKTDSAIQNVQITTLPHSVSIYTDKNGNYNIDLLKPDTNYTVSATRDGYVKNSITVHVLKDSKNPGNIPLQKIRNIEPFKESGRDVRPIHIATDSNKSEKKDQLTSNNSSLNESEHSIPSSEKQSRAALKNSSEELNLSGRYSGKLYQKDYINPSNEAAYDYSIELARTTNIEYSGTSKIIIGSDYGIFRLSAVLINSILALTEEKVLEQRLSNYPYWCIKHAELDVISNNGTIFLSGKWSSDTYNCNPGRIELKYQGK